MALSARKYGRFTIPTTRYSDRRGNSGDLRELVNAYLPSNVGAETPIATLARVAATLQDPITGEPVQAGQSGANNGTPGTLVSAVEKGDGHFHRTILTPKASCALPDIPGTAALGLGKLFYTFPAGVILLFATHMDLAIKQTDGNITADTPEVGIGTTIASGAVAVLSGTAAFENIVTGQVAADCDGTKTDKSTESTAGGPLLLEAGDDHTVYFNVADTWAASGDDGALIQGQLDLVWAFLGL